MKEGLPSGEWLGRRFGRGCGTGLRFCEKVTPIFNRVFGTPTDQLVHMADQSGVTKLSKQ